MKISQPQQIPVRLAAVVTLAHLLERLEAGFSSAAADQYRSVALRLAQALAEVPSDDALRAVLGAYPAAAEVYENLNYQHAGLCRSPLEAALDAELRVRAAIAKAQAKPALR